MTKIKGNNLKKLAAIIFMLAISTLWGCDRNSSKSSNDVKNNNTSAERTNSSAERLNSPSSEKSAADFTSTDLNGKKISLSDFRGKVVILDFWATWCPPCRRGIPDLISIQKEFKNKVVIIGVSLDTDTKSDVVPFVKNYGINYHIVYGTDELVKQYGGIDAIPTSFVLDQNGKIVSQHVGLTSKETYLDEINQLLKKS